jgi:ankyrin repeat protein
MGLSCLSKPAVVDAQGLGEAEDFQLHYSLDDARSLHALSASFTASQHGESVLVQELIQRSVSQVGEPEDEAVIRLFQLIEAGVPLNTADENGETPIFAAARAGRLVMMEQLLSNGASAEVVNWDGSTPLHEAALYGHEECVVSLLEHNPSLGGVKNREGDTPMHLAAREGHQLCVRRMLDVDPGQYEHALTVSNKDGLAPVHVASRMGSKEVLERLYEFEVASRPRGRGVDATVVTCRDMTGKTALIHAVMESWEELVQMLLMRGADPNASDNFGKTAQHYAVLHGGVITLRSLLESGGDPAQPDGEGLTPFCYCAMRDNSELLLALLAECLMFRAIEEGDVEAVEGAIEQIEHCSALDPIRLESFGGNTPLHMACRRGALALVTFLIDHLDADPGDLRKRNEAGDQALHVACSAGKVDCVRALLLVDIHLGDETTSSGDTAMHIGSKAGHTDLIVLLTATFNLSTEARNSQDNTPLHEAVCVMQYEPVKALVAAGANVVARDASGATSLDLAGQGGLFDNADIFKLLSVMVEKGVVEEVQGGGGVLQDLIELSDGDDMFEEMDSMDVCNGIGRRPSTDDITTAFDSASLPMGGLERSTGGAGPLQEPELDAMVVQKTIRLPKPTQSPFGALRETSYDAARGFQKFSSSIKRVDDSELKRATTDLLIKPEDLQVFRNHVLGEGSFGVVYLGVLHGNKVAVKVFKRLKTLSFKDDDKDVDKAEEREQFLTEVEAMADLRHDNIQAIRGYCILPEGRAIVSAYYDRGSLVNILSKARNNLAIAKELSWSRRLRMAIDVAKALMAMHNRVPPRIHCDLKAANCFVDSQWNAYIGDFGFTRAVWSSISLGPTNPRWLSPEINLNASFTESSDVYAFGMLLWELMTWQPPYGRTPAAAIYNLVAAGVRPDIPPVSDLPGDPDDNRTFFESGAMTMYLNIMKSCWYAQLKWSTVFLHDSPTR